MPVPGSADLRARLADRVEVVAPGLLGALVSHAGVTVRVTEVEAYGGALDEGSHAFRGRTRRNAMMFGPAGRLYCYVTYGMHVCANVVTGPPDEPSAVLLRAGEVVDGLLTARARRPGSSDRNLARGPGRLCRALAITLDANGADLLDGAPPDPSLRIVRAPAPEEVSCGPRVGLRGAPDVPWRFWLTADPSVSAYRPASPRTASP